MANQIQPIRIDNFEGGLNLADDTLIGDNQLSKANNFYYNSEKKLQTRYGQAYWGQPVPDAVKTISACDVTTGWSVGDDGATLSLESSNMKRGVGALKFNISVAGSANNDTILTNSSLTAADITTTKGYVGFWFYAPASFTTELTDVKLRIGTDNANYYEFTFLPASITNADWSFLVGLFSEATTTGTPTDTNIAYAQLIINYTASYTDKTGVMVDDIVAYSATATKPQMSLKYFEESITPFTRHLVCNVNTNVFSWDETTGYWNVIKTGVTDGARYSMAAYKNIQYYTNGVDNYASWNGKTWTEHTGANTYKGKYLLLANDIGYILGDPSVPSSLAYTAATPANLQTFPNVLVLDEDSSDGIGTGLINLGPVIIASKDRKIYKVNIATPSREQLDYSDGNLSGRSFCRVENEVFLLNDGGVYTLSQREATTGSLRADPLSGDLTKLLDTVTDKTTAAAFYDNALGNFYLFFDENDDEVNDTCIVFSTQTKKWTKYTNTNANEMVKYKDKNGIYHLLIANSTGGQCKEIETGFDDCGNPIKYEFETKNWDFGQPETYKTFEMVEIHGFVNEDGKITVQTEIDGSNSPTGTIEGSNFITSTGRGGLGAFLLGYSMLGGESDTSAVTLYPFSVRLPMYATGSRIKVKCYSEELNNVWIISKISIYPYAQPLEIYPTSQIL